ncbi:hypothetical protein [Stutzerimonas stutzeri]|uniref:hypothetical protein n=1 Tax=Stutzerimonas stutzeri TaxID=316 RepID=UPI000ADC182C|nr:hypothetical protein [Stutzerimonas stutzeri]
MGLADSAPTGTGRCRTYGSRHSGEFQFFRSSPGKRERRDGWGGAVQKLISAGHSLEAISSYTLEQINLFMAEIGESEKESAKLALIVARASRADKEGFKAMLKEFS